jgi:hypothetical protein
MPNSQLTEELYVIFVAFNYFMFNLFLFKYAYPGLFKEGGCGGSLVSTQSQVTAVPRSNLALLLAKKISRRNGDMSSSRRVTKGA